MGDKDDAPNRRLFTEERWNGSRTPAFRPFLQDLHAGADARRFEHIVNGNPERDYTAIKDHFDAVWRGLFKQGIIRSRVAGRKHDGALQVTGDDDDDDDGAVHDDA